MLKKLIQIFRPGRHLSGGDGRPYEFTPADLRATAAAYDPAKHAAPIVIGHPRHDAPAWGWVKGLAFSETANTLEAEHERVDPHFAELVASGRYRNLSAAFYAPDSPHNPVPGAYYLRHVGVLGAQPPAVKGLPAPAFAEDESYLEFAEQPEPWFFRNLAGAFRRLRDFFIAEKGLEQADVLLPDYQVASLEDEARRLETVTEATPTPSFAEATPEDTDTMSAEEKARLAQLEAENARLKAREAEFAEREIQLAAEAVARERTEIATFAEGLIAQGRVLPKDKAGLVEFIAALPVAGAIEFAEGDATVKVPSRDWLKKYLTALPPQIEFGERAGAGAGGEPKALDLADSTAIANAAVEFCESERQAGREISVARAVQHVTAAQKQQQV